MDTILLLIVGYGLTAIGFWFWSCILIGRETTRLLAGLYAMADGYFFQVASIRRWTGIIRNNHVHHFNEWEPLAACHGCGRALEEVMKV